MRAINLLGSEVTLSGTPTNVSASMLVRCVATTIGVVTRATSTGSSIGTCTVITTEPTYIFKDPGDTLTASGTILASPITFMY